MGDASSVPSDRNSCFLTYRERFLMDNNLNTSEKEREILGLIHSRIGLSRAELVDLTGLSAGLISAIVRRLISSGHLIESGLQPSKLGRRRVALQIAPGRTFTIGLEIGTFFLRVVVSDLAGSICHSAEARTNLGEGFSKVMERFF